MAQNKKISGLGKNLDELLEDNAEITNMRSNVLLHKNDGTSVKIYNKTGKGREEKEPCRPIVIKIDGK